MEITIAQLNKMVMEQRLAGRTEAQLERVLMDMARAVLGKANNLLAVGVMIKGAISWAKVGKPFDISRRGWEAQYGISRRACALGDRVLRAVGFRVGQMKRRGRIRTVYMLVDPAAFMRAFEAALCRAESTTEDADAVQNAPDAVQNAPDAVQNAPQPNVKSSPAAVQNAPDITRQYADDRLTPTDILPAARIIDDEPDWFAGFAEQAQLQRLIFDTDELRWCDGVIRVPYRLSRALRSLCRLARDCGAPPDVRAQVLDRPPRVAEMRQQREALAGVGD